jgi:hypothetical protein
MSKKVANHLHRYKMIDIGGFGKPPYLIYRCMKPACSHYIPVALSDGKLCECNRCHEPMMIGKVQLNGSTGRPLTLPHCLECTKKKGKTNDPKEVEAIAEFLKGVKSSDDTY